MLIQVFSSDDSNTYANNLKSKLQICYHCRDHFDVWPHRHDERYAVLSKDPNIRHQWVTGGDTNFARRGKPSSIKMRNQAPQLQGSSQDSSSSEVSAAAQPSSSAAQEPSSPPAPSSPPMAEAPVEAEAEAPAEAEPPAQAEAPDSPASYSVFDDEGLEDTLEQMLADDENVPSDDDSDNSEEQNQGETESIIEVVQMNDSFFRGKCLLLPVISGDVDCPLCCLCHQPVDDDGEVLTTHLEFKLRLNAILSKNPNTFGIVFDYAREDAPFQKVCSDCLTSSHDSPEGQTVRDSIFTISFHQRTGSLNPEFPTNVIELFNTRSKTVNENTVNFLRDRFTEQERMLRYDIK